MVGVEGIQTAIDEFRAEHPDIPLEKLEQKSEGGFDVYAAPGLSLLRGDFFELTSASAGTFDLVRFLFVKGQNDSCIRFRILVFGLGRMRLIPATRQV